MKADGRITYGVIFFIPVILAGVVWLIRVQVEQDIRRRKEQLLEAYPDFVDQVLLYVRAGLTVQSVFRRLEDHYRRRKEENYLYQEITSALHEMDNGVSSERALERFGRRCQLPVYLKFSFLLGQNVRKGTGDLPMLLEYEAKEAMEQRRGLMKKKGEEAGTKLLFPMMVMLMLVFLLLLIPAFWQM